MKITFLCNAGLALETNDSVLFVDLPNGISEPFVRLPDNTWKEICDKEKGRCKICGFVFTHDHPDHLDRERMEQYPDKSVPVLIPDDMTQEGTAHLGEFTIAYKRIAHAPIDNAPPHVVLLVSARGKTIYIAADSALNCEQHMDFLQHKHVDAAIWNSMYLSRAETRALLRRVSNANYIYHMPQKPDEFGMWKKLEKNMRQYAEELKDVHVIECYPTQKEI